MARAPTARLSFRTQPSGGDVAEPADAQCREIVGRRQLLLLIHGFNNSLKDSEDAYHGFEQVQRELGAIDEDLPVANGRVVQVYWPGDADWGIASPLFYPFSIERAQRTADALAATLVRAAREGGHKLIDVVAHSMGCRLTLELLKRLQNAPGITVGRVVLMAGAVPTFMLEPRPDKQKIRAAFDTVLVDAGLSLYSSNDLVLGFAFPLGQSIAPGDEGLLPTALGYEHFGAAPGLLSQEEIADAGHGDYWGWQKKSGASKCGRAANAKIKTFLRFEHAGERKCEERTPLERETPPARDAGTERVSDAWSAYEGSG